MTEQAETPKILDEISRSNSAGANKRSTRKRQTARRRFTIVVVILLPIVAGVLFLAYQQFTLQSQLAGLGLENQRLTQNLAQQTVQLRQLEQNQQQVAEPVEFDDSAVTELEPAPSQEIKQPGTRLADLQAQQLSASNASSQEWRILEAEYLLGIASQKLLLEADIATAIALLQVADQALLDSRSARVFAVRRAITADLQQLRNIEVIDRTGVYLQLDSLLTEMTSIDLLASMRTRFEKRRNAESQPLHLDANTNSYLDTSLELLASIFVWRKWEDTPQAMLAPGQDELIKQNLRLMLEQAQLALLLRDDKLYRQALVKSKDWFQHYAVTDSAQGRTLLAALDQLAGYDIDPALPSLNQSLSLINQLTASER